MGPGNETEKDRRTATTGGRAASRWARPGSCLLPLAAVHASAEEADRKNELSGAFTTFAASLASEGSGRNINRGSLRLKGPWRQYWPDVHLREDERQQIARPLHLVGGAYSEPKKPQNVDSEKSGGRGSENPGKGGRGARTAALVLGPGRLATVGLSRSVVACSVLGGRVQRISTPLLFPPHRNTLP